MISKCLVRKKYNAWKEISSTLGIDMEDAKTRYNSIRIDFSKYLKRVKSTWSGSEGAICRR